MPTVSLQGGRFLVLLKRASIASSLMRGGSSFGSLELTGLFAAEGVKRDDRAIARVARRRAGSRAGCSAQDWRSFRLLGEGTRLVGVELQAEIDRRIEEARHCRERNAQVLRHTGEFQDDLEA